MFAATAPNPSVLSRLSPVGCEIFGSCLSPGCCSFLQLILFLQLLLKFARGHRNRWGIGHHNRFSSSHGRRTLEQQGIRLIPLLSISTLPLSFGIIAFLFCTQASCCGRRREGEVGDEERGGERRGEEREDRIG
eukprot:493011-Hanusia_phi.AAC.1